MVKIKFPTGLWEEETDKKYNFKKIFLLLSLTIDMALADWKSNTDWLSEDKNVFHVQDLHEMFIYMYNNGLNSCTQ